MSATLPNLDLLANWLDADLFIGCVGDDDDGEVRDSVRVGMARNGWAVMLRVADKVTDEGDLTVRVKMELSSKVVEQRTSRMRMPPASMEKDRTLAKDVAGARDEDVLNDVIIKCGSASIPCSKFVLCSR